MNRRARRLLGLERGVAPPSTVIDDHDEWLQSLLEELRTPEAEREFAGLDLGALLAEPARMRELLEPFTQGEI